jgi:hypothetical protein
MKLEIGYYFVNWIDEPESLPLVGYYDGSDNYPWQVVGSDGIYKSHELAVLAHIPWDKTGFATPV